MDPYPDRKSRSPYRLPLGKEEIRLQLLPSLVQKEPEKNSMAIGGY